MELVKRSSVQRLLPSCYHSGITIHTSVLEPVIFVNTPPSAPSVLRGYVVLDISKEVQICHVTIRFRGVVRTNKFGGRVDEQSIIDQTWPVLEAGPHELYTVERRRDFSVSLARRIRPERYHRSTKDHTTLSRGRYVYDLELTLNQSLPESFNVGGSRLMYRLQAMVHRPGMLKRNVSQSQEVAVLRCPDEMYLHDIEHICLARTWNKQISYRVDLSGKGAPIGSEIPVSITISCQAIQSITLQVYLGQKIKYSRLKGRDPRLRRTLLLKTRCNNLAARKFSDTFAAGETVPYLNLEQQGKMVTVDANVPLPNEKSKFLAIHPDVEHETLQATHSLLFIIDVATPPKTSSPNMPTLCRLTAETTFCLRSPHTQTYSEFVPQYSAENLPGCENSCSISRPSDLEHCTAPHPTMRNNLSQAVETMLYSSTLPQTPPPMYQGMKDSGPGFPPPPAYDPILLVG